jgi:diaminohydroxyphosphoribosylaminopyrimidine deaminase/5-amino-6-(5-phosphoribosylamino)uracil reductase
VVFAAADPNPVAAGGAEDLRAAGVDVVNGVLVEEADELNAAWAFSIASGRPFVTLKVATTLDGRISAADGSSRWITGEAARADVHEFRSRVDAVMVGRGTVAADDPALTVRIDGLSLEREQQPLRVVVGRGELGAHHRVFDESAPTLWLRTNSLPEVLAELNDRSIRHVMLEGGATLASAFLKAGKINAVRWYVAPAIVGEGLPAVSGFGVRHISEALRLSEVRVRPIAPDVLVTGTIRTTDTYIEELS